MFDPLEPQKTYCIWLISRGFWVFSVVSPVIENFTTIHDNWSRDILLIRIKAGWKMHTLFSYRMRAFIIFFWVLLSKILRFPQASCNIQNLRHSIFARSLKNNHSRNIKLRCVYSCHELNKMMLSKTTTDHKCIAYETIRNLRYISRCS